MKIKSIIVGIFCLLSITACDTLKQIGTSLLIPSEYEMGLGLKQALEQGLFKGFDAYNNPKSNPALSFIFPSDAQKIINLANKAGLGSVVNQVTDKFNGAVAKGFTSAKPIFLDALKSMSFKDVVNVLVTNNQQAANEYFKKKTQRGIQTKGQECGFWTRAPRYRHMLQART